MSREEFLTKRLAERSVELERFRTALYEIIELDHHSHGPVSRATKIARAALNQQDKQT